MLGPLVLLLLATGVGLVARYVRVRFRSITAAPPIPVRAVGAAAGAGGSRVVTAAAGAGAPVPPAPVPAAGATPTAGVVSVTGLTDLSLFNPEDNAGPCVPVRFVIGDPGNARVAVRVQFSVSGGAFTPATAAPTSDLMDDVPAPSVYADYRFVWDAATDIGTTSNPVSAQLEFVPFSPTGPGPAALTRIFQVITTSMHVPASLPAPQPAAVLALDVTSGSNQKGISGQWLPDKLQVTLHDAQGNLIPGVAVAFTSGGSLGFDIERDPAQPIVTDFSGVAGVRVRVHDGATGAGWVQASVVGNPSVTSAQIQFSAQAPTIYCDISQTTQYQYGYTYPVNIDYNDVVNNVVYYEGDPVRPVHFVLQGANCILSHSDLFLPQDAGHLQFVPTTFDQAAHIKVLDPISGAILKTFDVTVSTTAAMRTASASGPPNPVKVRLSVVSGLSSPTQPQVCFPGLTLAQAFALQVDEGAGTTPYTKVATSPTFLGCSDPPPSSQALQITYTFFPVSGAGGLALNVTDTPKPTVQADSGQKVFFTPTGPGPWYIYASFSGELIDIAPVPVQYPDPANPGQTICEIDHGLGVDLTYYFIVQRPAVKLVAAPYSAPTDPPVPTIKAGDSVQLAFGRISPVAPNGPLTAEQVSVEALRASGTAICDYTGLLYTGLSIPFTSMLNVSTKPGGMVVSDVVMLTQGQPSITLTNPAITVVPAGRFHGTAGGADVHMSVQGAVFGRFQMAGQEPVQEAPTGSAISAGAAGTLLAHSGEFRYTVCDLDYVSRAGEITFRRTFRSASRLNGPLGPGWFAEFAQYLDVSGDYWINWIDSRGVRSTLIPSLMPRGYFVDFTYNYAITPDQSAYQIMDAHRNVLHFHPDGALRFVQDRFGNRTQYDYNEKGLVIRITDCHKRQTLLSYYQKGDPVDPKAYDKLKLIHDFASRDVNFTYYASGDPNGQPGWLKQVSPPSTAAVVNGGLSTNYTRSETYQYEYGPSSDPLDGRVHAILDSESRPWITNHYRSADRRIGSQDTASGSFSADYDVANRTATITDRNSDKVDYHFPESPYWDAAAPDKVTIHPDAASRPGAPDNVYTLRHNADGLNLSVTDPANAVTEHVYDDTQPVRSRGNLLAVRLRAAGNERIWSYVYDDRYNFVTSSFPARGNAAGENPWSYGTFHTLDYQAQQGDQGNIVQTMLPGTVHWTSYHDTQTGLWDSRWIGEAPVLQYTWNTFGLVTSKTDEAGIVTEYMYYSDSDPTGQASTPATAGGGFLASAERDTQDNSVRDRHFQDIPKMPLMTKWRYTSLGDQHEIEDPAGLITRTARNALHEVSQTVDRAGRPDAIVTDLYVNEYGEQARAVLHQSNPDPDAGGALLTDDVVFDLSSNSMTASSTLNSSRAVSEHLKLDPQMRPVQSTPAGTQSVQSYQTGYTPPAAPSSQATIDEGGRPTSVADASNTAAALTTTIARDDQKLTATMTDPTGSASATGWTPQGDFSRYQDPDGSSMDMLPDAAGTLSRNRYSQAGAALGGFNEARVDEWGRAKRFYTARFASGLAGSAPGAVTPQAYKPVAENFPAGPFPWPPAGSLNLNDGAWAQGDGRTTQDVQFTPHGDASRFVSDDLNVRWIRRDAHGRIYDWSDGQDNVVPFQGYGLAAYDVPNMNAVFTVTDHSSDPLSPGTVQYTHKQIYDPEGRVVCTIDGEGHAVYSVYDEAGHLFQTYDAVGDPDPNQTFQSVTVNKPGNVTTYLRDGMGRLRAVISDLTFDGIGGHPLDPNHTYNNDSKVTRKFVYDDAGFLRGYFDHENVMTEMRYDDKGRLEKVVCSPCAASPNGPTTTSRTYDSQNRIDTVTDANGTKLQYSYYPEGRVKGIKVLTPGLPGTQELSFHYDADANLDTAVDITTGHSCEFVYDSQRLMRRATVNGALSLECDYDGSNRRVLTRYPGGGDVIHTFDSYGRLANVTDGGTVIGSWAYLGKARVLSRNVMGVLTKYSYTGAGRLNGMTVTGVVNPASVIYVVEPDAAGRIGKCTRTAAGPSNVVLSRKWTYDSVGRIIGEDFQAPSSWPYGRATALRQYDGNNVLRQEDIAFAPVGSVAAVHRKRKPEERGRVISDDSLVNSNVSYDLNGNLKVLGDRKYYYDAFNRLDHVDYQGATVASYQYDALNRLVRRTGASGQVDFVWDGWRLIEVRQGAQVTERYTYGAGMLDPLTVELPAGRHSIMLSPEGSIEGVVDPSFNAEFYVYSLGGLPQLTDSYFAQVTTAAAPKSRLLLHGGLWDADAQCYYFRRRWYSPMFEQFLTPDPAGFSESANQYGFCLGDPVNRKDPMGAQVLPPVTGTSPGQRALAAGEAALGAGWAVADGMLWQPLLTVFDTDALIVETGVAWAEALTGYNVPLLHGYRHTYRSGVGKLITQRGIGRGGLLDGYGELLSTFWQGIISTPERMYEAALEGRAFDAGYEAMNLYMIGRTAQRLATSGFRATVNFAARRSLLPRGALAVIRNVQTQIVAYRMAARLPWRVGLRPRIPFLNMPEVRFDPSFAETGRMTAPDGALAKYGDGRITMYEGAFRPGDLPAVETPAPYRGGTPLGRDFGLRGNSPELSMLHELYHSHQFGISEEGYNQIARVFSGGVNYAENPLEFTQPRQPGWNWSLEGHPITGAHNYAAANAPLHPVLEIGVHAAAAAHSLSTRIR